MFSLVFFLFLAAAPVQDAPKPVISKDPLTAEQIAVYRVMLQEYTKEEKNAALNISNVTYPFAVKGEFTGTCPEDSDDKPASQPQTIHRMDPAVALNSKMVLVDPERQADVIRKNDPQNALKNADKGHQPPSDSDLDQSLKTAFSTQLFYFSEIVFNKQHTRAILEYGSFCGMLCGHGNTVIFKKVRGKWKMATACRSWIS